MTQDTTNGQYIGLSRTQENTTMDAQAIRAANPHLAWIFDKIDHAVAQDPEGVLERFERAGLLDTTNDQSNGPRNLQLENTLDVIDSLRHLLYSSGVFRDIEAAEPVLFAAGDALFEEEQYSRDPIDLETRAFGSYLLLQAVIRTPGALDAMMEALQARVVAHLRPDLLRVFDEAHASSA